MKILQPARYHWCIVLGSYLLTALAMPLLAANDARPGEPGMQGPGQVDGTPVADEPPGPPAAQGLVQDKQGQLVGGVELIFRRTVRRGDKGYEINLIKAVSDEKGQWKTNSWNEEIDDPGAYELTARDGWEVISPRHVTLPQRDPVNVQVQPVEGLAMRGRVHTPDGQPIAEATVTVSVDPSMETEGFKRTLKTDADGCFVVQHLKPQYRVSVDVVKDGYWYIKGGFITRDAQKNFAISDIVLSLMTGRLEGQVVDAQGNAVAGAHVLCSEGASWQGETSDAEGRFTLTNVPEGEVTVIAAHPSGVTTRTLKTGGNHRLTLKPVKPTTTPDIERAYNILADLWETSRGSSWYARNQVPATLAPYAFERALPDLDDKKNEIALREVLVSFIEAHPEKALEVAAPYLDRLVNPTSRYSVAATLALAIADSNPQQAAMYYQRAKTEWLAGREKTYRGHLRLASVAARLGNMAEVQAHYQQGIAGAQADEDSSTMHTAVATLAEGSAELALKTLPLALRNSESFAILGIYDKAITKLASFDLEGALNLLSELQKAKSHYAVEAAILLIKTQGDKDPALALKLANEIENPIYKRKALRLAAVFQPRDKALTLLRETANSVIEESRPGNTGDGDYRELDYQTELSEIATTAYAIDPATGAEMFKPILQFIEDHFKKKPFLSSSTNQSLYSDLPIGTYSTLSMNVPLNSELRLITRFAGGYGQIDRVKSRLLLEKMFVRIKSSRESRTDAWMGSKLATAMASIDVDRALEIAWQLHLNSEDMKKGHLTAQFIAQHSIARLLLTPPLERIEIWEL